MSKSLAKSTTVVGGMTLVILIFGEITPKTLAQSHAEAFSVRVAPILYVMTYDTLDEVVAAHNAVPQGLSSAIFTSSMYSARDRPARHLNVRTGAPIIDDSTSAK